GFIYSVTEGVLTFSLPSVTALLGRFITGAVIGAMLTLLLAAAVGTPAVVGAIFLLDSQQVRRLAVYEDVVTAHNTRLAQELGLTPRDVDRRYFPKQRRAEKAPRPRT
ncbi:MAG: hypothetical protein AB2A00_43420, partial [Myxococcota bacterium]